MILALALATGIVWIDIPGLGRKEVRLYNLTPQDCRLRISKNVETQLADGSRAPITAGVKCEK